MCTMPSIYVRGGIKTYSFACVFIFCREKSLIPFYISKRGYSYSINSLLMMSKGKYKNIKSFSKNALLL
nr:hypothetical protein BAR15_180109 [Bartonella sp. AR 15-3]